MNKSKSNILTSITSLLGGILGSLSGSDNSNKIYRRIFIPLLIISQAYYKTDSILVLTIFSMIFPLSLGYGIPDFGDKGSKLGAFFYFKVFNYNHRLADLFSRGTIGALISLSLISIPVIRHNWVIYGLCSLGIILTNSFISWRNFGEFKLLGKEISVVETVVWGVVTLLSLTIIYY